MLLFMRIDVNHDVPTLGNRSKMSRLTLEVMSWDSLTVISGSMSSFRSTIKYCPDRRLRISWTCSTPGTLLRNGGDGGDQLFGGLTVHQVVGRVVESLPADVTDEEGGKTCRQVVHQPCSEVCANDADQGYNRGEGILAVIPGDRLHGRALQLFETRRV